MKARKRFGQHFLQAAWAATIADATRFAPGQAVIEVGPGQGVLTRAVLERHPALTAIEIDRDLIAELRDTLPAAVQLVEGDVLRQSWPVLCDAARAWHLAQTGEAPATVRVIGNLPYNIASPLLIDLLHAARDGGGMLDAVVMVQREVAERLVAPPDTADYGPLAVVMQTVGRHDAGPGCAARRLQAGAEGLVDASSGCSGARPTSWWPTSRRSTRSRAASSSSAASNSRTPCRAWRTSAGATSPCGWPRPSWTARAAPGPSRVPNWRAWRQLWAPGAAIGRAQGVV